MYISLNVHLLRHTFATNLLEEGHRYPVYTKTFRA